MKNLRLGEGERNRKYLALVAHSCFGSAKQSFACLYVTAEIGAFLTGEQIHYVL